ncbi:MAG: MazG family protein, partial [Candidatus Eremiobacteraeota bacterium]|nr:MazG family protein [Candidatus Eremiobacteraeota bacterium]
MNPQDFQEKQASMGPEQRLSAMVDVLTGPQGCPWDQKQTAESIIDYVIDEAHELKAALLSKDHEEAVSELGDLLFTVSFLTHSLRGRAEVSEASDVLVNKMVRRHPHVFAEQTFRDESELKRNWESEKRKEKSERKRYDQDLPASLPPLERTRKVLARASNAGFRYQKAEDAWDKVWEELIELESAGEKEEFEDEMGDLLVALLTLA